MARPVVSLPAAGGHCRRGRRPNLSLLADRCATHRQLLCIHATMLVSGRLADDPFAASRLLAAAAAASSPRYGLLLLSSLPYPPNSFMWNTTLSSLAASPSPASAFPHFALMRRRAAAYPGKHTFAFLLKACVGLAAATGEQVHALVVKFGLNLDVYVGNGLVRVYAAAGFVDRACKVFDRLPERNSIVWTTMISGYVQNERYSEAMVMFDRMVGVGLEPRDATMASVLSACARSGGLEMGLRIHAVMEEKGMVPPGMILGTALVDMYAKNGAMAEALTVFEGMPERNTATWNVLISGLAHHGHGENALQLFGRMQREGMRPNSVTFIAALSACCHAGLLEEGRRLFGLMQSNYGVEPRVQHYGCMVDILGRSGRLAEAEEMIKGMRCAPPDVAIWGALLAACKSHGDIDIAERVVQEMLKLEPSNRGVYVVLSNMYAEAGRWLDVDRLRRTMRKERLTMIPGSSTIGGDGDCSRMRSSPWLCPGH